MKFRKNEGIGEHRYRIISNIGGTPIKCLLGHIVIFSVPIVSALGD